MLLFLVESIIDVRRKQRYPEVQFSSGQNQTMRIDSELYSTWRARWATTARFWRRL